MKKINVDTDAQQSFKSSMGKNLRELIKHPYGVFHWIIILVCLLFVYALFIIVYDNCWLCNSDLIGFDENEARKHLKIVTGFGSHTAGSVANEVDVYSYLRKTLMLISQLAERNSLTAVYDEQLSSYSSFRIGFHLSSYTNVRNLVIRISDPRIKTNHLRKRAFLVSCHYDSAIDSPGASDTFANCANMLEVAKIMASGNYSLYNDLVFLFNNAEENMLIGSHAFITQHRWANDIAAFINLEGAGAGKRLMVFQISSGMASEILTDAFAKSFYQPFASVFGEDIFTTGKVPSDTDFRIFRDYGLIPGLDLAYVHDGYVYHTVDDTESRISSECLQQSGRNLLSFLSIISLDERIQNLSKLVSTNTTTFFNNSSSSLVERNLFQRMVYFDLLGYKFFFVSWWLWKYFNYLLIFSVLFYMLNYHGFQVGKWYMLLFVVVLQLIVQILGAVILIFTGYILHHFGCRMTWYSNYYNLIGVYVCPFICWLWYAHTYFFRLPDGFCLKFLSSYFYKYFTFSPNINQKLLENAFFDSGLVFLLFILFVLNWFNIPSSFLFGLWLFVTFFVRFFNGQLQSNLLVNLCKFLSFMLLICMVSLHVYISMVFLRFVIPIMGRSGNLFIPDILIALLIFCILFPFTLLLSGYLQCTSKFTAKHVRFFLLNAFLSYVLLIHSSPYGFPYSIKLTPNTSDSSVSPRYQRLWVFHTNRFFHYDPNSNVPQSDSMITLIPLDVNDIRYLTPETYYRSFIPSFFDSVKLNEKTLQSPFNGIEELSNIQATPCNTSLPICGLAVPISRLFLHTNVFMIPAKPHSAAPHPVIKLLSRSKLGSDYFSSLNSGWNLTFTVTRGPPQTNVILRLDDQIVLHSWSFKSKYIEPFPLSLPSYRSSNHSGTHYYLYHLNAAAISNEGFSWNTPWTFWIVLEMLHSNSEQALFLDLAITGIYVDRKLDSGTSPELEKFISRLPPWVTVVKGCSIYEYSRFRINS